MKQLLLLLLVLTGTSPLFAQTGTIKITNNNASCTAHVVVFAEDITYGNNACDIVFGANNTIVLPPGATTSIAPAVWTLFGSTYGIISVNPQPAASTTFQFTDVTYQWDCPSGCAMPPTDNSGVMSDPAAGSTCYPGTNTYTGTGCTAGTSTWNNTTMAGLMDNIIINLN